MQHCQNGELHALANVHSVLKETAEEMLYRTVRLCTAHPETMICLRTLSDNSHKAGLIRSLTMEYHSPGTTDQETFKKATSKLTLLAIALRNMHGLYDLNIISWSVNRDKVAELEPFAELNDTMRSEQLILISSITCSLLLPAPIISNFVPYTAILF